MPNYPADANDTVVYNGVDLYVPKDCSVTVFEDSRVFLFGEWYLNGSPLMSGSSPPSGLEVAVGPTQPVDPGIKLWYDTSLGYGELKVFTGGSWIPVEDPNDAAAANEVSIGVGQPVPANYELWVDTSSSPENLKAKVGGSWKSINSEVAISGVEPTDPAIELWVDTATTAPDLPTTYISAGNALGIIAVGSFVGNPVSVPSPSGIVVTNTLVVTLLSGRRYRVNFSARAVKSAGPAFSAIVQLRDGATNISGAEHPYLSAFTGSGYNSFEYSWVITGDGTTKNLNVLVGPDATIDLYGGAASYFNVEDLGPVSRPAYPLTSPPPDGYVSPGNALGIVAMGAMGAGGTVPAATDFDIAMPIVFTSLVGRRYRVVAGFRNVSQGGANASGNLSIWIDGVSQGQDWVNLVTSLNMAHDTELIFNGTGLTSTYSAKWRCTTTITGINTDGPSYFYIEDIGPNTSPALPIPATAPAWTPLTLATNWANGTNTSTPCPMQYRKIGDMVYVRGTVKWTSTSAANIMATLPAGFRPPYTESFCLNTRVGTPYSIELRIYPGGDMQVNGAVITTLNEFGVEIQFSVTP